MRLFWLGCGVVACGGTLNLGTDGTDDTDGSDPVSVDEPVPDLAMPGPFDPQVDAGQVAAGDDCTLEYDRFRPDGGRGEVLVVLAHGFARTKQQMAGWARLWASWGAKVVTPQLCFLRVTRTDHPANGRSLAALADALDDGRPVIFAGHSAGGLAATLAAAQRGNTPLLVLDPVDNNALGAGAVAGRDAPTGVLLGEPSSCNANGSGTVWAGADAAQAWRVDGSDHCDFESPSDGLCTALCRRGQADHERLGAIVAGMSTGFVLWHGGLDARGAEYWTPGEEAFQSVEGEISAP